MSEKAEQPAAAAEKAEEKQEDVSRGPSPDIIGEDPEPEVYVPKNPPKRPQDVEISENLMKLMAGDQRQEQLHRILGAAGDRDNEKSVAEHMQKVFNAIIENCPS